MEWNRKTHLSRLCTQFELESAEFDFWKEKLHEDKERYHRKVWELCFVAKTLSDSGVLKPEARGLGFAVGQEPLPSLFASLGCEIIASDMNEDEAKKVGWIDTNQHSNSLEALNKRGLCAPEVFRRLASFRTVDMNHIPSDLRDFDFTWSCCSFEHVGSIDLGLQFIMNQLDCLKPGGLAVHTTEYNVSSNRKTWKEGQTVLFRRRDFNRLATMLRRDGHRIELDFHTGTAPIDKWIDVPPYSQDRHLKLQLGRYASTSIGLIVQKRSAEATQDAA